MGAKATVTDDVMTINATDPSGVSGVLIKAVVQQMTPTTQYSTLDIPLETLRKSKDRYKQSSYVDIYHAKGKAVWRFRGADGDESVTVESVDTLRDHHTLRESAYEKIWKNADTKSVVHTKAFKSALLTANRLMDICEIHLSRGKNMSIKVRDSSSDKTFGAYMPMPFAEIAWNAPKERLSSAFYLGYLCPLIRGIPDDANIVVGLSQDDPLAIEVLHMGTTATFVVAPRIRG